MSVKVARVLFAVGFVTWTAVGCASHGTPRTGAGRPWYGDAGYDSAGGDRTVRPGDDFNRYANGTWIDLTRIPADKPLYSLRMIMSDTTERRVHELLESAAATCGHEPATLEGKVGAYYKSFMDEARIDSLGASPLDSTLAAIRAARTPSAIAALMGRVNVDFEGSLFDLGTDIDYKDPTRYAVYLTQAGLGLPDRDYYLQPSFAAARASYESYVAGLLQRVGWPEPAARAHDVLALETEVAAASWTRTQQRDVLATYNAETIAQLEALAPGFPWKAFLDGAGLGRMERVIVAEKTAFPKLAAIFARTPIATLQAWLAFSTADDAAPYLSRPFGDAWFAMHRRTLVGQQAQAARWKRAVQVVSGGDFLSGEHLDRFGNVAWAVGQLYAARWFPPSAKAQIVELIGHLKDAYHARIEKLDWMSPATRAMALKKLETYRVKVGYPDKPRDYAGLVIRDDDLAGNARRSAAADWAFYVNRLPGPVDRDEWNMTPQTNDAYNGSLRDVVFPAAFLQPPVFDANADPAYNYGAVGGVIGHELTHGFDDQGRKLDAEGKLADWWAPRDAREFESRAAKLGAQYSSFEPLPGVHVNGALTMGENIADLGGLTLALDAYHASLHGAAAPVVDGLTGDQRVFLGWAQAWRGKLSDDAIRHMVVSDPHSPRMYRVNGVVRNIDAWYDAFGVKPGDKLYLAPAERVHIW